MKVKKKKGYCKYKNKRKLSIFKEIKRVFHGSAAYKSFLSLDETTSKEQVTFALFHGKTYFNYGLFKGKSESWYKRNIHQDVKESGRDSFCILFLFFKLFERLQRWTKLKRLILRRSLEAFWGFIFFIWERLVSLLIFFRSAKW